MVVTAVFCWRSRNIKEVKLLPKFIMGLACIEGLVWSSNFLSSVFFEIKFSATVRFWINIVSTITSSLIIGLLIRFQRVQVQLRAQEEDTIKILSIIKRANILEFVFVFTLVVYRICVVLGIYGEELFGITPTAA